MLLVWIRNGFADAGVVLPCFDLALALMWEGTRGEQAFPTLTKPWLARSTKATLSRCSRRECAGKSCCLNQLP